VIGRVDVASSDAADGVARPSPGMMDRHYSPAAGVIIAETADVSGIALREHASGARVVVLARSPLSAQGLTIWPMPDAAADYARLLYGALHRADAEGYQTMVIEAVPPGAAWDGVRDRLRRAAR
jgi:L-threonylcarbamoyladenylate synthase